MTLDSDYVHFVRVLVFCCVHGVVLTFTVPPPPTPSPQQKKKTVFFFPSLSPFYFFFIIFVCFRCYLASPFLRVELLQQRVEAFLTSFILSFFCISRYHFFFF